MSKRTLFAAVGAAGAILAWFDHWNLLGVALMAAGWLLGLIIMTWFNREDQAEAGEV